ADAVTVNPYMGRDSIRPYLDYGDRRVIMLCRRAYAGGADLQHLGIAGGTPLYLHQAAQGARAWHRRGHGARAVGAAYPGEISRQRQRVGDMPLVVPGIGARGGDIRGTVGAGRTGTGRGVMLNASGAVLHASGGEDCVEAAAKGDRATRSAIRLALIDE